MRMNDSTIGAVDKSMRRFDVGQKEWELKM